MELVSFFDFVLLTFNPAWEIRGLHINNTQTKIDPDQRTTIQQPFDSGSTAV